MTIIIISCVISCYAFLRILRWLNTCHVWSKCEYGNRQMSYRVGKPLSENKLKVSWFNNDDDTEAIVEARNRAQEVANTMNFQARLNRRNNLLRRILKV